MGTWQHIYEIWRACDLMRSSVDMTWCDQDNTLNGLEVRWSSKKVACAIEEIVGRETLRWC